MELSIEPLPLCENSEFCNGPEGHSYFDPFGVGERPPLEPDPTAADPFLFRIVNYADERGPEGLEDDALAVQAFREAKQHMVDIEHDDIDLSKPLPPLTGYEDYMQAELLQLKEEYDSAPAIVRAHQVRAMFKERIAESHRDDIATDVIEGLDLALAELLANAVRHSLDFYEVAIYTNVHGDLVLRVGDNDINDKGIRGNNPGYWKGPDGDVLDVVKRSGLHARGTELCLDFFGRQNCGFERVHLPGIGPGSYETRKYVWVQTPRDHLPLTAANAGCLALSGISAS